MANTSPAADTSSAAHPTNILVLTYPTLNTVIRTHLPRLTFLEKQTLTDIKLVTPGDTLRAATGRQGESLPEQGTEAGTLHPSNTLSPSKQQFLRG